MSIDQISKQNPELEKRCIHLQSKLDYAEGKLEGMREGLHLMNINLPERNTSDFVCKITDILREYTTAAVIPSMKIDAELVDGIIERIWDAWTNWRGYNE